MTRVLITGIRSPVAYDLAQKFVAAGHEVAVCDCLHTFLGRNSKAQLFLHASPVKDFEQFLNGATAIIQEFKPDIIIPMNEEVFYWAKLANIIDIPLYAPSLKILLQLHSKYRFIRLCEEIGIAVPKTDFFEDGDIDYSQKVLKREYSRFGESVYIRPKLVPQIDHDPQNPYICQEYIKGRDICFFAIAKKGEIVTYSCYFSNWRAKNGASYYFSPADEETAQKTKSICAKIIKHLAINGQISFDLRQAENGELFPIECNPRATSGIHILAANPNEICDAFLIGKVPNAAQKPKYIFLAMLFYGLPNALVKLELLRWLEAIREGEDVFKGKNIYALFDILGFQIKALLNGQTLAQYLTHDIECNRDLDAE